MNGVASTGFQHPLHFPIGFTLLDGCALVVRLFTLGEADFQLGAAMLPVELQRDEGVALALGGADQLVQFLAVQQQLAGARRVRLDMRGGRGQRREMRAHQERLVVLDHDIAFLELRASGAQALDLPTLEHEPGLELLLDEIVVPGLAVLGDDGAVRSFFFLGHRRSS